MSAVKLHRFFIMTEDVVAGIREKFPTSMEGKEPQEVVLASDFTAMQSRAEEAERDLARLRKSFQHLLSDIHAPPDILASRIRLILADRKVISHE